MSDLPPDRRDPLNLQAEIEHIERDRAETRKLAAEHRKLAAEALKFSAEQFKLMAEGRKFNRDIWFLLLGAALTFAGVIGARLPEILRGLGWLR